MARRRRRGAVSVTLMLAACSGPSGLRDGVMVLPAELRELSGMVAVDEHTLACVQDELGVVFFVSLLRDQPLRQERFGAVGDYEGIAATPDAMWVLRSDGTLFRLRQGEAGLGIDKRYRVPFDGEFEGLCHDPGKQRLLVLPKGPVDGKRKEQERRRILGFDLEKMKPIDKPVLTLKVEEIEEQIEEKGLPAPRRTTKKGKERVELRLLGSELLVLPGGDLLLLSPKDHLLIRLDDEGRVVATGGLDPELLPQPESMALLPDGRLLVGTEGRSGDASIVVVPIPR